jgi:hypothetical protein
VKSECICKSILLAAVCLAAVPAAVRAAGTPADSTSGRTTGETGVTYLVPSLQGAGYHVSEGKKKFKHRISFSPGIGQLGKQDFFAFRVAYSPNSWLGYEISLGHNPASSLHAMLHSFNAVLRYPIPWRVQPYAKLGYGMMTVYPGEAINADPVTKNTLTAGGGLEFYIRDDVAFRGEILSASVFGQERDAEGTVAYVYRVYTIGFSFYRNIGN